MFNYATPIDYDDALSYSDTPVGLAVRVVPVTTTSATVRIVTQ